MNNKLRPKFLNVYSNLPLNVRKEIIAVIDNEPMTWHVCYLEVQANTKLGDTILEYLDTLKFI